MFFDVKQFSLKRKGRFAKCWLAATCPKQFRKFVNRTEVDNIQITILCDNILKKVFDPSALKKDRLSLQVAAKLAYGTVCIHQQQVESLYQYASNLLLAPSCILFEPRKRKALTPADKVKPPKKHKAGSVAAVVSRLISDFHDSIKLVDQQDNEDEAIDLHSAPIDSVTLREAISVHIDQDDMDGFDVLTEAERMEFLYGDLSPTERQRCIEEEAGMLIVVAEANEPDLEEMLCSQKTIEDDPSVPVYSYRSAARANNTDMIPYVSLHQKDDGQMEVDDPPPSHSCDRRSMQIEEEILLPKSNDQCRIVKPLIKKSKKFPPIIDAITTISGASITNKHRYDLSKRCSLALNDIVDITEIFQSLQIENKHQPITHQSWIAEKSFKRMVAIGTKTQIASVLQPQFHRRKTARCVEPLDEEWILEMCGELPKKVVRSQKIHQVCAIQSLRSNSLIERQCEINSNNSLIVNQKNMEVDPTESNNIITTVNRMPTLEAVSHPQSIDLENQLNKLLQSLNISTKPLNNENSVQPDSIQLRRHHEIHLMSGTKAILEKLIHLWRLNIQPIDMKILLRGVINRTAYDRRYAAVAFYTLLELHKIGFILLHQDDTNNQIRHISKTIKLKQLLDSFEV